MIITICGPAGSGKSTVSKKLAQKLGYKHYSIGDLRRKMASERGMTLAELNKLGEEEEFTDKEVDEFQARLGKKEDNFVIDGRTSWYFIPNSIKVYLDASLDVRTERMLRDERVSEKFNDLKEAKQGVIERDKSDVTRYIKYYNLDVHNLSNFDLVIDTGDNTEEDTVNEIVEYLEKAP